MLSIGRAHAETSCERIFQAQLSEKTLRNIVNTWHMNHTISYNFYRFATCFLKSLKLDLIFLQCWKIAVSSTSHTITGPDPRARHFFNPGTKAAVTRALRRSQSDASFFASESSTLRPGIVDHGGSWWIIDHVWSDWVAPSRKSERTSMGFEQHPILKLCWSFGSIAVVALRGCWSLPPADGKHLRLPLPSVATGSSAHFWIAPASCDWLREACASADTHDY